MRSLHYMTCTPLRYIFKTKRRSQILNLSNPHFHIIWLTTTHRYGKNGNAAHWYNFVSVKSLLRLTSSFIIAILLFWDRSAAFSSTTTTPSTATFHPRRNINRKSPHPINYLYYLLHSICMKQDTPIMTVATTTATRTTTMAVKTNLSHTVLNGGLARTQRKCLDLSLTTSDPNSNPEAYYYLVLNVDLMTPW